eukprot:13868724-Alexandrium_andersonii.AAC.1
MSNPEILEKAGSNKWFFQGKGFGGMDMSLAAEHVLATLESSRLPDGATRPIVDGSGREFVFRAC